MTTNGYRREKIILIAILLLGSVHGLIYVFAMPAWQYNEEPSHFEYAWLIASRLSLPEYPAYDQEKRREIAASMIEHDFYANLGFLPDLNATDEPIWIGTNVSGALPLYHIIAAIPLRMLLNAPVETQLYALRLLSLIMFEVVLVLAYLIVGEFFPVNHRLRWLTPACIAMLPSFVHLMTSVNNDVGATLMFSIFILTAVRLIKYGVNLSRFIGLTVAALLCCLTKNTIIVALPLAILAVWLALIKSRWAVVLGILMLAGGIIIIGVSFGWGDAAFWYRNSYQQETSRVSTELAPWGGHAFLIEADAGETSQSIFRQLIPTTTAKMFLGKKVTLGAWIWADQPVQGNLPALYDGTNVQLESRLLSLTPTFYWMTVPVPQNASHLEIQLIAPALPEGTQSVKVYYDGILLVSGKWQVDKPPVFSSSNTQRGSWGGKLFINPIRNASAESVWVYVQPRVEKLTRKIPWLAHLSPGELLASTMDVATSRWLYRATIRKLFETFWAKFAWESISIPAIGYQILKIFSLIGVVTTGIFSIFRFKRIPFTVKSSLIWVLLATAVILSIVLFRGFFGIYNVRTYIPVARYGFPVVIPMMLILCYGWHKLINWMSYWGLGLLLGGFLVLDLFSIITWLSYFSKL